MNALSTVLTTCFFLFSDPTHASESSLTIAAPGVARTYTLTTLKKTVPVKTITVDDLVYRKKKTYDAFELTDLLKLVGGIPASTDEIAFQALDGYAPTLPMTKLTGHKAYVAFQEHSLKQKWSKIQQGKAQISPGPFYVVWEEGKSLDESYPWSYQLARIDLISFAERYPKMYPRDVQPDSAIARGFAQFKSYCMRCHSVNLEGGSLGPELNVPLNVTEYFKSDVLPKLIRSPSAFRSRSKMPDFDKVLSEKDVQDIVEYLSYMREHKQ